MARSIKGDLRQQQTKNQDQKLQNRKELVFGNGI
jgi:hypothetical protein